MYAVPHPQPVQVTCIKKLNRDSRHEGITHIGAHGWLWPTKDVIAELESSAPRYAFFTLVNGNRGEIGVVNGLHGKYLRTYADGKWNDNLLALDEC